ncbi:MAG: hypothetical protein RLZZ59_703 [Pseudomonadota bacterium]|jgi:hypothetical protein
MKTLHAEKLLYNNEILKFTCDINARGQVHHISGSIGRNEDDMRPIEFQVNHGRSSPSNVSILPHIPPAEALTIYQAVMDCFSFWGIEHEALSISVGPKGCTLESNTNFVTMLKVDPIDSVLLGQAEDIPDNGLRFAD